VQFETTRRVWGISQPGFVERKEGWYVRLSRLVLAPMQRRKPEVAIARVSASGCLVGSMAGDNRDIELAMMITSIPSAREIASCYYSDLSSNMYITVMLLL
jgi:hypothetical protein